VYVSSSVSFFFLPERNRRPLSAPYMKTNVGDPFAITILLLCTRRSPHSPRGNITALSVNRFPLSAANTPLRVVCLRRVAVVHEPSAFGNNLNRSRDTRRAKEYRRYCCSVRREPPIAISFVPFRSRSYDKFGDAIPE